MIYCNVNYQVYELLIMIYREYFNAAQRHRETCDYLIKKIKDPQEYIEVPCQKKILQNIYYLSGYIIECIISYTFFSVINYDIKKSVYDLDDNNSFSYKFHIFFKDHSINSNELRIEEIRKRGGSLSSEIPIIGDVVVEEITKKMYFQWNSKSRYTTTHLDFEVNQVNVIKFFTLASDIYLKMKKI